MSEPTLRTIRVRNLLAEGQSCERCERPLDQHSFTQLGAVACRGMPRHIGPMRWEEHRFVLRDGEPYISIMEQVGILAGIVEGGLPKGCEMIAERIVALQQWLNLLMPPPLPPLSPPVYKEIRGAPAAVEPVSGQSSPPITPWVPYTDPKEDP